METGTVTEQDTRTFATKLDAFSRTLTPGEQAVLALIEQQLSTLLTTDDDVQGYMFDLGEVAMVRQRELLDEADRLRGGVRSEHDATISAAQDRAGFWQRIATRLSSQATAMAPRPGAQPATG